MTFFELLSWLLRLLFRRGYLPGSLPAVVKLAVLSRLFPYKTRVAVSVFGFRVHGPSYHAILFLLKEIFLEQQYRFEASAPAPLIFDCGSNIGISVLYFKYIYPSARVVCFEPQQNAFDYLTQNIVANGLADVAPYRVALGNTTGEVNFFEPATGTGLMASLFPERETHGTPVVTPLRCLSWYMDAPHDLLKIDVEGAEALVLTDLSGNHKLNARNLVVEFHHGIENSPMALSGFLALIETNGYTYRLQAHETKVGDVQDLLIRCRKKD